MHLKEFRISGFKSISNDVPQKIFLEDNMTVFIGSNGTGKSTAMEALCTSLHTYYAVIVLT